MGISLDPGRAGGKPPLRIVPGWRMVGTMTGPSPLLLFAGTTEARLLGDALAGMPLRAQAIVTEPPRGHMAMQIAQDLRRFGGVNDLVLFLRTGGYRAIVDASHGFDGDTTRIGYAAARALGLPHLRLARPVWNVDENSRWQAARDVVAAMARVPPGARVFSATGWDSLPDYAGFPGAKLLLRQTRGETRPMPYAFVEPVFGVPPFTKRSEVQLFEEMGVDLLICRNLGGQASRPKLDAATRLGLDVILIDPPEPPQGMQTVHEVEAAADWVRSL